MFITVYIILLLLLVLFSWIASIYGVVLPSGELLPGLLSAESLRWFVRHSIENIAAAPIVEVLLLLLMIGALRSCGLSALFRRRKPTSLPHRQRHAAGIALVIFGLGILMLLGGILLPSGNLLSVTGHIAGGPLASGWLFVLVSLVCVPCVVYGLVAGVWRSGEDVVDALTTEVSRCSGYFVTLIVASQLVAALEYVRLYDLLGIGQFAILFNSLFYLLPLLPLLVENKDNS